MKGRPIKPRPIHICPNCNNPFEVRPGGSTKFCSNECKYAKWSGKDSSNYKQRNTYICNYCGKSFLALESNMKNRKTFYCSVECKHNDKHPELVCEHCNNVFITNKWKSNRFCSYKCYCNSLLETSIHILPTNIKICEYCQKEYTSRSVERKFCSYDCAYNSHVGPGNPNWRGGTTNELYCWKFNNKKREEIRNNFNRICFICGKNEIDNKMKLAVHHIDYNKSTLCNNKNWPLIPLCQEHHGNTNGPRYYWFNLLISYWAFHTDITLVSFPFASIELSINNYEYNNNIKY
jgi:hypothetical protein